MRPGKKTRERRSAKKQPPKERRADRGVDGLEDHWFSCSYAVSAKDFDKVQKKLSAFVLRQGKGSTGSVDVSDAILSIEELAIELPDPDEAGYEDVAPARQKLWLYNVDETYKRWASYVATNKTAYATALEICTPALLTKIKGTANWADIEATQSVVPLLQLIRALACQYDDTVQPTWALVNAKLRVSLQLQQRGQTLNNYLETFLANVRVVESFGGEYGFEPSLLNVHLQNEGVGGENAMERITNADPAQLRAAMTAVRGQILASIFVKNSFSNSSKAVQNHLANSFSMGRDEYPTNVEGAVKILNGFKTDTRPERAERDPENEGLSFIERGVPQG